MRIALHHSLLHSRHRTMAELAAALAALAGTGPSSTAAAATPKPLSPAALGAHSNWFVPPHLLRLPAVRASAFAAHDCSIEAVNHPQDFDRVYRYGLSLQELASKLSAQPADQLSLLHQAAEVYMEASTLQGGRHAAALYNWAVALTDIARLVRAQQPDEAYECLTAAASKYAQSLAAHPDNPQACNNWGLVLQDLSAMRPAAERGGYLRHSLSKFRRALRLRPDFDRAVYNLGTVLYSHACSLQEALLASQEAAEAAGTAGTARRGGGSAPGTPLAAAAAAAAGGGGGGEQAASERAIQATFAHAAQYIVLAYAMQPGKQVYADSLAAVQRLLPLPYLRSGALLAVRPGTEGSPAEEWVACWFGLDSQRLAAVRPPAALAAAAAAAASHPAAGSSSAAGAGQLAAAPLPIQVELADVADARLAADPSLPAGAALWVSMHSRPSGMYFVAPDQDDAEGWVDALLLLSHLLRTGDISGVRAALAVRR
ncbi:hypothetical protein ABPG75_004078 [Micractinium tetrahymenae]